MDRLGLHAPGFRSALHPAHYVHADQQRLTPLFAAQFDTSAYLLRNVLPPFTDFSGVLGFR